MLLTIKIPDKKVYDALSNFLKVLNIEIVNEEKDTGIYEDREFYNLSATNLGRSYSADEPEYSLNMIKEPNPDYEAR